MTTLLTCRAAKQHPLVATAVLDAVALLPAEEPAGGASLGGGLAGVGPAAMAAGPAAAAMGAAGMDSGATGGGATSARAAARAVAMQGVVWLATAVDRACALPPAGSASPFYNSKSKRLAHSGLVSAGRPATARWQVWRCRVGEGASWCHVIQLQRLHCPSCLPLE